MAAVPPSCLLSRSYSEKRTSAFGETAWVTPKQTYPYQRCIQGYLLCDSITSLQTAGVFLKKPIPTVIFRYENFRPSKKKKKKKNKFLALAAVGKWTRKVSPLKFCNEKEINLKVL